MSAEPLRVEIVAYAPTAFYHCAHCEVVWQETGFSAGVRREQAAAALPPDLLAEYQRVSDWVHDLLSEYGDRLVVKVVDAASVEGAWKTLRHGLRRYPVVIVGERAAYTDLAGAEQAIAQALVPARKGGAAGG